MAEPTQILTQSPEAEVVSKLAQAIGMPRRVDGYAPYAIVPDGAELQVLGREEPELSNHVTAKPTFKDAGSFIAYVNRFKSDCTQIFADIDAGRIVAVIDYHHGGELVPSDAINWCHHAPTLLVQPSPEWTAWLAKNGKQMDQTAFAQHLEDRLLDVIRPDGATMLEIATSMEASKSASFKSAKRLSDGRVQFQYVEDINGTAGPKGDLDIPREFDVGLAPFVGTSKRKVTARLRYRIDSGSLVMWYELWRLDEIKREAFEAIMGKVKDETAILPYLGSAG